MIVAGMILLKCCVSMTGTIVGTVIGMVLWCILLISFIKIFKRRK